MLIFFAMKFTAWARRICIHPNTARRWFRFGHAPVPDHPRRWPARAERRHDRIIRPRLLCDQNADLDRRLRRLRTWAGRHQLVVIRAGAEVGSGLNVQRRRLIQVLASPTVPTRGVEHRDRLAQLMDLEAVLRAQGPSRARLRSGSNDGRPDARNGRRPDDVCAQLHGRRSARASSAACGGRHEVVRQHGARRRETPPSGGSR